MLAKGVLLALVIGVCRLYVNVYVRKVFERSVYCFGKVAPSRVGQKGNIILVLAASVHMFARL